MKRPLAIVLLLLAVSVGLGCKPYESIAEDHDIFTIYLVRHAEKDVATDPADPPLTPCGRERAQHLSTFLNDVHLDAIYSTDYARTKETAQPTARAKGLTIKEYNPVGLEEFSADLMMRQQDVLVVGHSTTTGVLAGLLVGDTIGPFDESIYNRIYQVVVCNDAGRLHVLHTSFVCED